MEGTGIWTLDTTTGTTNRVMACDNGFCPSFVVSDDGQRLAVAVSLPTPRLIVKDLTTAGDSRIIELQSVPASFAFTPDSNLLVDLNGSIREFSARAESPSEPVVYANPIKGVDGAVFSPDGRWIAFTTNTGDIYISDITYSNPILVDHVDSATIGTLVWSPDSTQIAYGLTVPNVGMSVLEIKKSTLKGTLTSVYSSPAMDASFYPMIGSIAFSPDGKRLAFVQGVAPASALNGTFLVNADGGTAVRLIACGYHIDVGVEWLTWAGPD
jgi:WD40 repeat protein